MKSHDFAVGDAAWPADAEVLKQIRTQVFIREQNVPPELEWDGLDPLCRHVLARAVDGTPIGTARLTPQHTLGRMAVLKQWRNRGVGSALLDQLLDRARNLDWPDVRIHAQQQAVAFYAHRGFEKFGEPFEEAGLLHRHMRIDLTPHSGPALPWRVETRAQLAAAMLELARAARHQLRIRSRELDPGLLDAPELLAEIKRIATSGRRADVRVLVHETDRAVHDGHGLIALAQRLPSTIAFRRPVEPADRGHAGAIIANDAGDYLLRPIGSRFEAKGEHGARGPAATVIDDFDAVWERSEPCVELRRLDL